MPRSMMIAWVLAVFTFSGARSEAELMVVETTTELVGLTSVTVQTGFQETEYTLGDPILLTVDWQSSPIAMFDGIELKRKGYTPIAKRGNRGGDPAEGTEPGSVSWMSNSVSFEFQFTELHSSPEDGAERGTAHFKLYLLVDADNDGTLDTRVAFGVNVHVTDPN